MAGGEDWPERRPLPLISGMRNSPFAGILTAGLLLAACGGSDPSRAPSSITLVSGNNQVGAAGLPLTLPLTVRVTDKSGDPVTGVTVDFTVASGGGSVGSPTATTSSQGLATSAWTVGTTVGAANAATATVAGLSGSPVAFAATVQAAPASTATILQGDGQSGTIGQALGTPVQVQFKDAYGNAASSQTVTWVVTGGGGSVAAGALQTDPQGRASATWTLGYEVGNGQALKAQAGSGAATATATGILSAGSTLTVASGDNQLGLAGTALVAPVGVRVRTANGRDVAKVAVAWAVATGGGQLASDTTLTGPNGVASVAWTLGAVAGPQTVTASDAALTPASVTFSATAVLPAPSGITGTVSLVDSQLTALRWSSLRGNGPASAEPSRRGYVRRPPGRDEIPGELIVRFKPGAVGFPGTLRALQSTATAQSVAAAIRGHLSAFTASGRTKVTGVSPVLRAARIRIEDLTKVDSVAQALLADPAVADIGPNGRMYIDGGPVRPGNVPNDPNYPNQSWHYSMIDLPRAWSITQGSSSVIVAVLDNGFVFHHPALGAAGATYQTGGGNLRNDGYDFVSTATGSVSLCASVGGGSVSNTGDGDDRDPDPSAPDDRDPTNGSCLGARESLGSHGTHVSGTVGAMGNDGVSVTGVNWNVSIRPVRVLGMLFGDFLDIADGILYAGGFPVIGAGGATVQATPAARIINLSLGGDCPVGADPIHDAVQVVTNPNLANGGVLVVASAGNDATSVPSCPAAYPEVLSVGAVGPSGHRSSFSDFGSSVDIAAPGGEFAPPADGTWGIYSSVCDFTVFPSPCLPRTARYFGTSMAAPHVAGVAALLLAQDPTLKPADLRARLTTYATALPATEELGAGLVNARNALTQTTALPRQIYVRAVNAATGAIAATVQATGGNYSLSGLPDGSYFVVAGQDESGDGFIGLPGRRFGAYGGISAPTAVPVSSSAGAFVAFTVGYPVEKESNDAVGGADRLLVDGAIEGGLSTTDVTDNFRIQIPAAGTYSFETSGFAGAFCSFALDLNTTLELLDQAQGVLASNVDIDSSNNNYCSRITVPLASGTYYLRVTRGDFFGTGPHTGRYILQARTGP